MTPNGARTCATHLRTLLLALLVTFVVLSARLAGNRSSAQVTEALIPDAAKSAAIEHFRSGVVALQGGNSDTAIEELNRAIAIQPNTGEFHAAISAAYLAKKNIGLAWAAARKAYALSPGDPRANDQLMTVWSALESQGSFRVGRTADEIRQSLGDPDRVNEKGASQRWVYGYLAIDFSSDVLFSTVDLRGDQRQLQHSPIRLAFRPDPAVWKVKHRSVSRFAATTEFEPVVAAAETLLIQRLYGQVAQRVSPRKWMEQARRLAAPANTALDWTVLEEDQVGLLYQWWLPKTEQRPAHWELTRVLQGARDLHRISFITEQAVDAEQAEAWKTKLSAARLVKLKE